MTTTTKAAKNFLIRTFKAIEFCLAPMQTEILKVFFLHSATRCSKLLVSLVIGPFNASDQRWKEHIHTIDLATWRSTTPPSNFRAAKTNKDWKQREQSPHKAEHTVWQKRNSHKQKQKKNKCLSLSKTGKTLKTLNPVSIHISWLHSCLGELIH
jgi:hypothetical protein